MPPTIPVSEYQEAYQKCYQVYQRQGPGTVKTKRSALTSLYCRPPWNTSMMVPEQPFKESLDSAEVKLRLLEMFEGDCSMDMIFYEIKGERTKEGYYGPIRNTNGGEYEAMVRANCGGGCGQFRTRPTFDGPGGGGKGGLCKGRNNFGGRGGGGFKSRRGSSRNVCKCCKRKERPTVYMNGSQLELVEDGESVLSHDADDVLKDMWKRLEDAEQDSQEV